MENFRIIESSPILKPYVHHYWSLRAETGNPTGDRVIPTGSINLIFHRANSLKSTTNGLLQPKAFVSGLSINYSDVVSMGTLNMLVVVFRPMGIAPFLATPLNEFRNMNVPVYDIGDAGLKELADRVLDEASDEKAVAHIEKFLIARLPQLENYNYPRINAVLHEINKNSIINVSNAARIACLSPKQFKRVFSAQVGIRPKDFMRIVRFQRALYLLQTDPGITFAQLAAGTGYFDQAHMIREFREFSGYTPVEYLSTCVPHSDYFS